MGRSIIIFFIFLFLKVTLCAQSLIQESNQSLYKLEDGKIYCNSTEGSTWKETVQLSGGVSRVIWNHRIPEHVVVVGKDAVYLSHSGGREWMLSSLQLPSTFDPTTLAIITSNSNIVYLTGTVKIPNGSRREVGWTSRDGGMMWFELRNPEAAISSLADSTKYWYAVPNIIKEDKEEQR